MENDQIREAEAERVVKTYSNLILRLSYTYLKSTYDAEDICQIVFLKLLKRNHSFDNREHEKAWIIRTTANACKDTLRSGFRRTSINLSAAENVMAPAAPDDDVLKDVMALPDKYREAIYLHYFEGYSIREISSMTGRSIAAVSTHLCRARKKLQLTLKGMDHGRQL